MYNRNKIGFVIIFISLWYVFFQCIPILTPGGILIPLFMGTLSLLVMCESGKLLIHKTDTPWVVSFLLIAISIFYSIRPSATLKEFIKLISYYCVSMMVIKSSYTQNKFFTIVMGFEYFALFISFMQILTPNIYYSVVTPLISSSGTEKIDIFRRYGAINGLFIQTGMNAFYMSTGFIISASRMLYFERRKILNGITAALFMFCIMMTQKRSFFIISVASIFLMIWVQQKVQNKNNRILNFLFFSVLYIGIITLLPELFPELEASYNRVLGFLEDRDIGNRAILYNEAIRAIKQYPLGLGYGGFFYYSASGAGAHNSYLQIIAELGWVGGVLFFVPSIVYFIQPIKRILSIRKEENSFCFEDNSSLFFQLMFFVYALSGNPFDTSVFLFLMFCFQRIQHRSNNNAYIGEVEQ